MADTKISALTTASTPLAGTEVFPIVQSGATKKATILDATNQQEIKPSKVGIGGTADRRLVAFSDGTNWISGVFRGSGGNDVVVAGNLGNVATIGGHQYDYLAWTPFAVSGTELRFQISGATKSVLNSSGNYVPNAGLGVSFSNNTAAAGMTSQLLNWYEEGTFTPTIIGTTSAGTGTYSTQSGTYTRVGRVVTFSLILIWSAHTGTGDMRVNGLPFTPSSVQYVVSAIAYNLALTAGNTLIARTLASTASIELLQSPTGGGAWSAVPMDTSVDALIISGSYTV